MHRRGGFANDVVKTDHDTIAVTFASNEREFRFQVLSYLILYFTPYLKAIHHLYPQPEDAPWGDKGPHNMVSQLTTKVNFDGHTIGPILSWIPSKCFKDGPNSMNRFPCRNYVLYFPPWALHVCPAGHYRIYWCDNSHSAVPIPFVNRGQSVRVHHQVGDRPGHSFTRTPHTYGPKTD
jgi:hypothetical protein